MLSLLVLTFAQSRVQTVVLDDEARAVIHAVRAVKQDPSQLEAEFTKVAATKGYRRLRERELSMGREFGDEEFKEFLSSTDLGERINGLEQTLDRWEKTDVSGCAKQALSYLPKSAKIKATVLPVIKPKSNSFVFDVAKDPCVFLWVDPAKTAPDFRNTVTHEFHHIGLASCPVNDAIKTLSPGAQSAANWITALGEGMAMLAAAGSPETHPHQTSPSADRRRWDTDLKNFGKDLKSLEAFLTRVVEGKLDKEQETKEGMGFFGVQGPWYTVGWKMAVTVEKKKGRKALIACMTDMRQFLKVYNTCVAGQPGAVTWSGELLKRLGV